MIDNFPIIQTSLHLAQKYSIISVLFIFTIYLRNMTTFSIHMAKSIIENPISSPEYPPISATMLKIKKINNL